MGWAARRAKGRKRGNDTIEDTTMLIDRYVPELPVMRLRVCGRE